ncbi:MAG: DUF952 domain-containing protein [Nocardioides sp.]|nr:DUF952 domain-containing protein [Nocardioides sp.]
MQIFHIAEKARWDAAKLAGSYAHSTLGRTLDEEGFIHAAREDQWTDVHARYYGETRSRLVLLTIDTDKLTSPWQEDEVGDESYPHIYGPLNPSAVVEATLLPANPRPGGEAPGPTLMSEFVSEARFRMVGATCVMVFAAVCGFVALHFWGDKAGLPGLVAGLLAGSGVVWLLSQRRDRERSRS